MGRAKALQLAKQARTVLIAKGTRVTRFAMASAPPTDVELLRHMLGPTGNLRAPALQIGQTLLIGFHKDVYKQTLG